MKKSELRKLIREELTNKKDETSTRKQKLDEISLEIDEHVYISGVTQELVEKIDVLWESATDQYLDVEETSLTRKQINQHIDEAQKYMNKFLDYLDKSLRG